MFFDAMKNFLNKKKLFLCRTIFFFAPEFLLSVRKKILRQGKKVLSLKLLLTMINISHIFVSAPRATVAAIPFTLTVLTSLGFIDAIGHSATNAGHINKYP